MAQNPDKLVVLDVYADWCISRKMESEVIPRSDIQDELRGILALRADVTRNDAEDRRLLRSFGLFGPPTFVFLKENSGELDEFRVQGEIGSRSISCKFEQRHRRFGAKSNFLNALKSLKMQLKYRK